MRDLNIRQRKFVRGIKMEDKSASLSYADSYGGSKDDNSTQVKASQLLRNPKIVKTMEEYERELEAEGLRAFQRNVDLTLDPKTPANVRNDINKDIQNKSGIRPTQQVDVKDTRELEGLTDDKAKAELARLFLDKYERRDSKDD